jgi:hypothetical protein
MTVVPGINLMPVAVAASSPDNVWLFSSANRAFRWDGQRWTRVPGTKGMPMGGGVVLGPSNAWTAGGTFCDASTLYHRRMRIPRIVNEHGPGGRLVVSSPSNIWIANIIDSPIMHWNGHRWSRLNKPPFYVAPAGIVPDGHANA